MAQIKGQQQCLLPINKIRTNTGQVTGLPRNPRFIRDARYLALKKSIEDFPEMLELREIVVFPWKSIYVCIGGNMRFVACKELGLKEIPSKILPKDFPVAKLREFAIKDNADFGQNDFDILANEWSDFPLTDWGMEIAELVDIDLDDFFEEVSPEPAAATFPLTVNFKREKDHKRVMDKLLTFSVELDKAMIAALF